MRYRPVGVLGATSTADFRKIFRKLNLASKFSAFSVSINVVSVSSSKNPARDGSGLACRRPSAGAPRAGGVEAFENEAPRRGTRHTCGFDDARTCSTSSRVGTRTTARGPSRFASASFERSFCSTGSAYAAVLPLPVLPHTTGHTVAGTRVARQVLGGSGCLPRFDEHVFPFKGQRDGFGLHERGSAKSQHAHCLQKTVVEAKGFERVLVGHPSVADRARASLKGPSSRPATSDVRAFAAMKET